MRKREKTVVILLGVFVLMALTFFVIDYIRVKKEEKPLFCINLATYTDGGTKVYYGLGYKIIDFHKMLELNENSKKMNYYSEIKIGTWFMDYHDFNEEIELTKKRIEEQIEQDNTKAIMKAVVVKADDKHLMVMGLERPDELIMLGNEPEMEFKQGQEIAIHFDGMILTTYPAQLGNVQKIEILKEESGRQIPEEMLRYCYSSYKNVTVTISEFTNTGISLTITDTNELPYRYAHCYKINQKVKNEEYTGVGYKIGENTGNTTAGYTRNRGRI